MVSKCTSFPLDSKLVQRNYQRSSEDLKPKIFTKHVFNEDHFGNKGNIESRMTKKHCFVCFCRFVTCALSLRSGNRDVYVFQAFFGFYQLLHYFLFFKGGRIKVISIYNEFRVKRARFLLCKCTSFLLGDKPGQQNY